MSDWRQKTLETYDHSAEALAEYFQGVGARTDDIERALTFADIAEGRAWVVELGCGDGRDAIEIIQRVSRYEGIDNSEAMIGLARRKTAEVRNRAQAAGFWIFDMLEYEFPDDIDIVFAFASLLHLDREEISAISDRIAKALRPGGIFYISLKYKPEYGNEIKVDEYGTRQFFFYTPELISELAGPYFESVYEDTQTIGDTEWFTIALRKISSS